MATDPVGNSFHEVNWRRKLTPAEEAEVRSILAGHPEALAEWEAELALSDALERIHDAPLASNFTARVLQAATLDAARRKHPLGQKLWLRRLWIRWVPATAGAALALGVGLISYHEIRDARRIELVRSAATLSEVASLPSPQVLEDFDAIHAMSQRPTADEDLLKALQ